MSLESVTTAAVVGPLSFAFTSGVVSNPDDLSEAAKAVLDAVMSGQGWLAAALALVFVVAFARKFGKNLPAPIGPFLQSDIGGDVLVAAGSFGGALATAFAAGSSLTGGLLLTALGVAAAAMGGYRVLAKRALPLLDRLAARFPFLAPVRAMAHWLLDREPAARPAPAKPEEQPGVQAIVGKPEEIE